MTPSQIIEYARALSGTRVDEIDDTDLFLYMNTEYRKLWQEVALADKNYHLETLTTNIVQWVSQYELRQTNQTLPQNWQIKIEKVLISYSVWQVYPYSADRIDRDSIDVSPEEYDERCPVTSPKYIITWQSIRIFPSPKTTVTWWLQVYSNQRPYDLTSAMWEDDILIEREYHDVIAWMVIPYIYQQRQQDDRVWYYQQQAMMKKREMMKNIMKRDTTPYKGWTTKNIYKYVY